MRIRNQRPSARLYLAIDRLQRVEHPPHVALELSIARRLVMSDSGRPDVRLEEVEDVARARRGELHVQICDRERSSRYRSS